MDVLARTGTFVTSATMSETSGSGDYTLDSAIIRVVGWTWSDGTSISQPERVSVSQLLAYRSSAGVATTTFPASCYAIAGANMLMVYPTPAAATTITVYYVPRPTAMAASADDPSTASLGGIPVEYHKAIEWYMSWQAADSENQPENAERYRVYYEGQTGNGGFLARIRAELVRKGGRLGRAQVGPTRPHRNARHDRSVYP